MGVSGHRPRHFRVRRPDTESLVGRHRTSPLPAGPPAADLRRRRRLQRLPDPRLEDRAGQARHRNRSVHHRVPPTAGHEQVEQDRTPAVLPDHHELARTTAPDPSDYCRPDRQHHHDHRTDRPLCFGHRPVPYGRQVHGQRRCRPADHTPRLPRRMELHRAARDTPVTTGLILTRALSPRRRPPILAGHQVANHSGQSSISRRHLYGTPVRCKYDIPVRDEASWLSAQVKLDSDSSRSSNKSTPTTNQCASHPRPEMRCSCRPTTTTHGKKRSTYCVRLRMHAASWRPSPETKPATPHHPATPSRSTNSRRWPARSEKRQLRSRRLGGLPVLVGLRLKDCPPDHQTHRRDSTRPFHWDRKTRTTQGRTVRVLVATDRRRTSARLPSRRQGSQDPESPIPLLTALKPPAAGAPAVKQRSITARRCRRARQVHQGETRCTTW